MRCVLGALRVPWREAHLTALRRVDGGREGLCWRLRLALVGVRSVDFWRGGVLDVAGASTGY